MSKLYTRPRQLAKYFSETRTAYSPEAQHALRLVHLIATFLQPYPRLKRLLRVYVKRVVGALDASKPLFRAGLAALLRVRLETLRLNYTFKSNLFKSNTINVANKQHFSILPNIANYSNYSLPEIRASLSTTASTCVVIPVYNAFEDFLVCLESVLTASNKNKISIIIINDCSTDVRVAEYLDLLSIIEGICVLSNTVNMGFVWTVNRGFSDLYSSNKDIIILNSDTIVFDHWIDRLVKVASFSQSIGTITPLTNNGTIASYPVFLAENTISADDARQIDQCAAELGSDKFTVVPTGVGFCMFIKRALLNEIGLFDVETFGRGYGEENDFCQRAILKGWQNIVAHNVFVYHAGSKSFGNEKQALASNAMRLLNNKYPSYHYDVQLYIENDPGYDFRTQLTSRVIAENYPSGCVLFVSHQGGGGVDEHVSAIADMWNVQGYAVLVFKPDADETNHINLKLINNKKVKLLEMLPLPDWNTKLDPVAYATKLRPFEFKHAHVHHLLGFGSEGMAFWKRLFSCLNVAFDVTIHDYAFICPQIHLIDSSHSYCGEPPIVDCEECVLHAGSPFGRPAMWAWRENSAAFLTAARRVFVPHQDVATRFARYFPDLPLTVRTHPEQDYLFEATHSKLIHNSRSIRLGFIGAIGIHKGSLIIEKIALYVKQNKISVQIIVIGYTDRDIELEKLGVTITGKYTNKNITSLLLKYQLSAVFISSVWPETYAYTLSHVMASNIFAISFDLGAPAERIRSARAGAVINLDLINDIPKLVDTLLFLCEHQPDFDNNSIKYTAHDWNLDTYYEL